MEPQDGEQSVRKRHARYSRERNSGTYSSLSVFRHEKACYNRNKERPVICPVNKRSRKVLDYRTHCLPDKSSHYDEKACRSVDKWTKRLQVQMRYQISDLFGPIFILSFLSALNWLVIRMDYMRELSCHCYHSS